MGTSTKTAGETLDKQEKTAAVELKGAVFTLPVLKLHSTDLPAIEHELKVHLARGLNFFKHAPLVIDLEAIDEQQGRKLDFTAIVSALHRMQLFVVGVRNTNPEQAKRALAAGMAVLKGGIAQEDISSGKNTSAPPPATSKTLSAETTKVIHQPVRSGQQIYAKGCDLIVLSSVNVGAEVIADGNIHVYGSLRGRALAGVSENANARIFAQVMEPELVAIAGNYQVFDEPNASNLYGKAAQIHLDNNRLVIAPI